MASDRIVWINASGTEYEMTGQSDIDVLFHRSGVYMPPISIETTEVPPQPHTLCGESRQQTESTITTVKAQPREVEMDIVFYGNTQGDLRSNIRKWLSRFNPFLGEGKLLIHSPDGTSRYLRCRYSDGLQGEESPGNTRGYWRYEQVMSIVFYAEDPYWYDYKENIIEFSRSDESKGAFLDEPFLPLKIHNANVFNLDFVLTNGDMYAWPIWEIRGPGSDFRVTNLTHPDLPQLGFPPNGYSLSAGEVVIIDTHPGAKTAIRQSDGVNLYTELIRKSSFWPLLPGMNIIAIEMGNATDETTVRLRFNDRFLVV